ncbi:MAG: glycosyltransferase family A protein [Gammaproteobacteria bacterium]
MKQRDFRTSIIITSYNHRGYLIEAIEGVLNQTVAPHEILVADDASSDGSRELIRSYEKKYPGLVKGVFQENNVGIPKNRNAALRVVTGNYVSILDGDDLFLPYKLERQFHALREHPDASVVYSNFNIVDIHRKPLAVRWSRPQPEGNIFPEVAKIKTGMLRTLVADYQAVKRVGFMDERFPKWDGLWLSIKLAATCRFAYVNKVLLEKRNHPTSDSKSNTSREHLHDLIGIYGELSPLLSTHANTQERQQIDTAWQQLISRLTPSEK